MLFRAIIKKFRTEEEDIEYMEEALWKFCAFASICVIMTTAAHISKTGAAPAPLNLDALHAA
jgi:hypothetical protein